MRWRRTGSHRMRASRVSRGRRSCSDPAGLGSDGGGAARRLTRGDEAGLELFPTWTRDGRTIAFVSWTDSGLGRIRTVSASGGAARDVTTQPGHYARPRFSPDGRTIVFEKGQGGDLTSPRWSDNPGVYRVAAAGGANPSPGMAERISRKGDGSNDRVGQGARGAGSTDITAKRSAPTPAASRQRLRGVARRQYVLPENIGRVMPRCGQAGLSRPKGAHDGHEVSATAPTTSTGRAMASASTGASARTSSPRALPTSSPALRRRRPARRRSSSRRGPAYRWRWRSRPTSRPAPWR